MNERLRIGWGLVLVLALLAHAAQKWTAGVSLQEMLWGCHCATAVLAIGLLVGSARAVTIGLVFHAGIGFPAYIIEILTNGTTATSVVVHAVPLIAGTLALRGARPDWSAALWTWGFFEATQLAALLTDPSLNVNVVFKPYSGSEWISSVAMLRSVNAIEAAGCIFAAMLVARWVLPRLRPSDPPASPRPG